MKKLFYKISAIVLILSLLPTFSFAETPDVDTIKKITYRGAIEKDDRLYISLRILFEELNAPILWDQKSKTVKVYYKDTLIEYKAGSKEAKVNNVKREMDSAPFLLKGTLYIPLKDTAQFISSSITEFEIDNIALKHFWGFTFRDFILLENEPFLTVVLPHGKYTPEDAQKIIDRYQGNFVHRNIETEFKGMEGDYYLFHTYFIPENSNNNEKYLWNRYLVHKETGELKVDY